MLLWYWNATSYCVSDYCLTIFLVLHLLSADVHLWLAVTICRPESIGPSVSLYVCSLLSSYVPLECVHWGPSLSEEAAGKAAHNVWRNVCPRKWTRADGTRQLATLATCANVCSRCDKSHSPPRTDTKSRQWAVGAIESVLFTICSFSSAYASLRPALPFT